ncbi:hypothetical protein GCM10022381_32550 [Leifsonia kafniensis]|uniref:Uncharacterized protein n=1 Tax=Leifsonia kafniensis TaxID=475957 RepID=A0ABP7KU64_9MICO
MRELVVRLYLYLYLYLYRETAKVTGCLTICAVSGDNLPKLAVSATNSAC